jgi:hypothetical protein
MKSGLAGFLRMEGRNEKMGTLSQPGFA